MGRKRNYTTKNDSIKNEIYGIIIIALSLLIGISIYFKASGIAEKWIKNLFLGSFGVGSYLLPVMLFIIGLGMVIKRGKLKIKKRFWGTCVLIYNLLLIIHLKYSYSSLDLGFWERILKSFENGLNSMGGGVISEITDIPLIYIFGRIGTYIVLSCTALIFLIISTEISISKSLESIFSKLKSMKKNRKVNETKNDQPILVQENIIEKDKMRENAEKDIERIDKKIKVLDFIKSQEGEEKSTDIKEVKDKNEAQHKNDAISDEIKLVKDNLKEHEYVYPPLDLLAENKPKQGIQDKKELLTTAKILEDTLLSFGVDAKVVQVSRGPAVTRYELHPSPGVKVSKITNLSDDIALNLAAPSVRIEAPIPGKAAVGIEVPNREVVSVTLREVIESQEFSEFSSKVAFGMGKDIGGKCIITDLSKMPHLLIAGATGSGKSVCINTMIMSLIYKASPKDVRMLLIDPKVVELSVYNGIPHLLIPVVTDPKKAASALYWAVNEMTQRYKLFADNNVRNIESYNKLMESKDGEKLPTIVIIIDELSDLMMVAPNDVEDAICRLAQMARAAGMHLIIATQRPSVDVITGVIKANIPSRISFAVSSQIDSRTILDMSGAEKLLGKGDMLFLPIGENKPIRIQGAFISEKEIEKIVKFLKNSWNIEYSVDIMDEIENNLSTPQSSSESSDVDELLPEAIKIAVDYGQVSASMLQRRLRVGFNRASRLVEEMEFRGIVGPQDGSKPRQVLMSKEEYEEKY